MSDRGAYSASGVDVEAGNRAVRLMSEAVRSTYGPEVLWGLGAFGGLYDAARLKEMDRPVLVASTDSVGTKTMVAAALGSYATLGQDIVNHCLDDILVQGAEPLFFLDYIAMPALDPEIVAATVGGIADACRAAGCALLGGETAELPGVYMPGELDLVGAIVGLVDHRAIIDGSDIAPGDVLLGLSSSGLHTNGYSLARKVFPPTAYDEYTERLGCTLGEALVEPHRSYLPHVRALRRAVSIKGLAHITGGGFVDNVPRILPETVTAIIERDVWPVPPLFTLLQEAGDIARDEMYAVFNMGVGLVAVVAPEEADAALHALDAADLPGEAYRIGGITARRGDEALVFA